MKRRLFLAVLALASTLVHAVEIHGSGQPATEKRAASGIHGIAMSIPGHLEVSQGEPEGVTITADDNVLPYLETVVENGTLRVRTRDNTSLNLRTPVRVVVVARSIENLALSGSGDIVASGIDVKALSLRISGAGNATLSGRASELEARISGSGRVDAVKLAANEAEVKVSGSGHVALTAHKTLRTHITGAGDVAYYGDPAVERHVTGAGRIRRAGAAPA
jgi:hypothetical protein